MAIEKVFEQLKLAALEVKSLLMDIDENIQPSVGEVEKINEKLAELSEQIAVYKFLKSRKELSPNLDIHLKVMQQETVSADVKQELNIKQDGTGHGQSNEVQTLKKLEINLNDKFRMINELFKQSSTEFNLALEQINLIESLEKSKVYLDELKKLYAWHDDHEMVVKLYKLNQKRFQ